MCHLNSENKTVNPTVVLTELGRAAGGDKEKATPMLSRIPLGKFAGTFSFKNFLNLFKVSM